MTDLIVKAMQSQFAEPVLTDPKPPENAADVPQVPRRGRAPKIVTDPMHCTFCKKMVELEWFNRSSRGVPKPWCVFCEAIDQPTLERRVAAAGRQ